MESGLMSDAKGRASRINPIDKRTVLTAVLVAVGICGFLAHVYHGLKTPSAPHCDLYHQYLPYLTYLKRCYESGSFPLWNPYQAVGSPFFAVPLWGALYPLNFLILPLGVPVAMLVVQFLNVSIYITGTILYLRRLKLGWYAVVPGTLLAAYQALGANFFLSAGSTFCWLPLIILLTHKLVERPRVRTSLGLALCLSLSFFGGVTQTFFYMALTVSAYFVILAFLSRTPEKAKELLRSFVLFCLAFLLTIGLVAVQLFPSMELSAHSVRSMGYSVGPGTDPLGFPFSLSGIRDSLVGGYSGLYFGLSMLFVPFAFRTPRYRAVAVASLSGFLAVLIYLFFGKMGLFNSVPLIKSFRFLDRALPAGLFMVSVLVAIGLQRLDERTPCEVTDWGTRGTAFAFLIGGYAVVLYFPYYGQLFSQRSAYIGTAFLLPGLLAGVLFLYYAQCSLTIKKRGVLLIAILAAVGLVTRKDYIQHFGIVGIYLPAALFLIFVVTSMTAISGKARQAALWLILLLAVADAVLNRAQTKATIPFHYRAEVPKLIASERFAWVRERAGYDRVLLKPHVCENVGTLAKFYAINSYDPMNLHRWRSYVVFLLGPDRFEELYRKEIFLGLRFITPDEFISESKLSGLLSLRYYVTSRPIQNADWQLVYEGEDDISAFQVYENRYALPRVYLAGDYVITHNEEESLDAIRANLDELSRGRLVVIEDAKPSFSRRPAGGAGTAHIGKYGINDVVVEVEAETPSLLVLTDSHFPGWRAFVDGSERPILRANSLFRAVEISPGVHQVAFKYRPASFRYGLLISLATLAVILAAPIRRRPAS